jgi:hypothetical protein
MRLSRFVDRVRDFLPSLARGAHEPGSGKACVMEYVSVLAGERWSDSPRCTHPVLAEVARGVNDWLPDDRRHELVPLIGRLFGTAANNLRGRDRRVLAVRLAAWCARRALGVDPGPECRAVLRTVEDWCDGAADERACRAAASHLSGDEGHDAARWLAHVPFYVTVDSVEHQAALIAPLAVGAALVIPAETFAATEARLLALLTGLLDEYDRLTGRTEHRNVTDAELRSLALAVSRS